MRFFDSCYEEEGPSCTCCYQCIKRHGENGCPDCSQFIATYFTKYCKRKIKRSTSADIKTALKELFEALGIEKIMVENSLEIPPHSFIKDFIHMCDEIHGAMDIVDLWHIDVSLAADVYKLYIDILESIEERGSVVAASVEEDSDKDTDNEDLDDSNSDDEDSDVGRYSEDISSGDECE